MNSRTWRAGALGVSIAVIVLLATQTAAGEPSRLDTANIGPVVAQATTSPAETSGGIPEPGGLMLLGSAFVVVAQQLRRLI
jgi:hypothetical protein